MYKRKTFVVLPLVFPFISTVSLSDSYLMLFILFSGLKADLIERLYNFKVEVMLYN